jgi:hypothetical protein
MKRSLRAACALGVGVAVFCGSFVWAAGGAQRSPDSTSSPTPERALLDRYCVSCHNTRTRTADLALDTASLDDIASNTALWERVTRKLRARAMPPAGLPRPDEAAYVRLIDAVEGSLDRIARDHPNPGRTEPFRRLNRTEYRNAIRDVLNLDVDVADLLPPDDASFGFDNVSVTRLSPTLMERYLTAAQKISRLAVGSSIRSPNARVVILPPDLTQESHLEGLPFGTRGGLSVPHTFPFDGEYLVEVKLSRDRNENVEGLTEPHVLEVALDGKRLQLFTVVPNRNRLDTYYADEAVDSHLHLRVPVKAGVHDLAVTFLAKNAALVETERQPYQSRFNMDRHPRVQPAVRSVAITGPFEPTGAGDTPSRRRVFVCQPASARDEEPCAKRIVGSLARSLYRRPIANADLEPILAFYRSGRGDKEAAEFEAGIEMALRALLTSPEFLFRIERDAPRAPASSTYRLSDVELASRLSFFLWSAPPDDTLLTLAEKGELSRTAILEREVRRMLADPRAEALTTNFAGQWLHLRNLAAASPDARLFPDFDDNLRRAFRRETELLFESVVREDLAVTTLLDAKYTFLNERLAKHYGVPGIYGDHFRRVPLSDADLRGGVLGHGSVLTVTSYATRTSPVLRGKWVLDNVLGMPPPPPPPNVPPLEDAKAGTRALPMRERMVAHRRNPACATCHQLMDPIGLSMEQFDAIGRSRTRSEAGTAIDASGALPGGASFEGVGGLKQALLVRPDLFARTVTEKLMTYALGRGVEHDDAPAVRKILRDAATEGYRWSAIVTGIVRSGPFTMRNTGNM